MFVFYFLVFVGFSFGVEFVTFFRFLEKSIIKLQNYFILKKAWLKTPAFHPLCLPVFTRNKYKNI